MAEVYAAIASVMAAMGKEGIGKDRVNEHQRYKFRGIDEVLNSLNPKLVAAQLIVVPSYDRIVVAERGETKQGAKVFNVTLRGTFNFIAKDGSGVTVETYGEAQDSADKATNKAMSAAFKYAMLQTFCIPTEGDNDADAGHIEVVKKTPPADVDHATIAKMKSRMLACTTASDLSLVAEEIGKLPEAIRMELRVAYAEAASKVFARG